MPSVALSAVASSRHAEAAVRNGAAKSERPDTAFEMLLDTHPDLAAEPASARGDDRTPPQTARCEASTAAYRTSGLTNSKPMDPRQARAIPAEESPIDETDAVAVQDPIDPDADDIEANVDATLRADPGSAAATATADPAASLEILVNPPASSASPTSIPVAVVMPAIMDVAAMPAAPTPSESETTALSTTLTPAAPVSPASPAMITAAASQGAAAAPASDPTAVPVHPAAPAVAATMQAQSPEHSSAAAQIPDFITQAALAERQAAAAPANPAVPATPANPQAGTAASPAIPATPANPARAAPSESADAQDAAQPPKVPPTESSAPNKPDDAPRPAAGDPNSSRIGHPKDMAKTAAAARPALEQTGREASRASGGANPVDQAPGTPASGTPSSSAAAKEANGESNPVSPRQHDLHEPAETLLQPGANETRPTGAVSLAAGHDVTGTDPARASLSAPTNAGGLPAGNIGATAPANAPYAMASSAPVPISGLAVELVWRMRDGKNRFEIRLDPPELGRIDVHLKVDRDGNVTSRLVVERSETLDLLRRDAPSLERALHNAGLKTGEQGLEFSLRNQAFDRDHGGRNESGASRLIIPDEAQPSGPVSSGYGRRFGIGGGIDIRV
ncbi:MAG: flagellar hook-length control protein FliK [Xanthobacteraceae bacterium]